MKTTSKITTESVDTTLRIGMLAKSVRKGRIYIITDINYGAKTTIRACCLWSHNQQDLGRILSGFNEGDLGAFVGEISLTQI